MTFYQSDYPPPQNLITTDFQFQPLTPVHVYIDYAAVMESRELLNLWSGGSWPTPDFTLAENLTDLEWHYREHQDRTAFTYTLLNPAGDICLGCLYIRPLSDLQPFNPVQLESVSPQEAMARFWVRQSYLAGNLSRQVLEALIAWFQQSWHFPTIYFHTRKANSRQVDLFNNSALSPHLELQMPQRGGPHIFWK